MIHRLNIILWLWLLSFVASSGAADSADRNRVRIEHVPVYAVSLHTSAGIAEGRTAGEQWRVAVKPVFAAEVTLWRMLSAGISVPFTIDAGHPYYGASSLDAGIGVPVFELGVTGGSGVVRYRYGIHLVPAGGAGSLAGGSIHIAFIRDPVALKTSGRIEIAPDRHESRLGLQGGGCTLAMMAVLNEVVSVELGMSVDIHSSGRNPAVPPGVFGNTAIYLRRGGFTVSFSSRQDLWNPLDRASIMVGVGWSKL